MSMTEVVEESLKADARFRHLTFKRDPNLDFVDIDATVYELWQDDPDRMREAQKWAKCMVEMMWK